MLERKGHFAQDRSRSFAPFLAPHERKELHSLLKIGEGPPPSFADALRTLARSYVDDRSEILRDGWGGFHFRCLARARPEY
ncbi:MAG: hypothetical protein EOS18_02370 [Mesorhizobium sp.]|nr:MAG: hypothetical protein EOS18_02370 [Mesorhizobium sp.]